MRDLAVLKENKEKRQQELLAMHAEKLRWHEAAQEQVQAQLREELEEVKRVVQKQSRDMELNQQTIEALQLQLQEAKAATVQTKGGGKSGSGVCSVM